MVHFTNRFLAVRVEAQREGSFQWKEGSVSAAIRASLLRNFGETGLASCSSSFQGALLRKCHSEGRQQARKLEPALC